jgi:hypothetical protein
MTSPEPTPAASSARLAATWALLRSFADWLPSPPTSSGLIVRRSALEGEAATAYRDCRSCGGRGLIRRSGRELACRTCSGSGLRAIDAYTGREVEPAPAESFAFSPAELVRSIRFRRVRCDGCGGSGRVSASSRPEPGLRDLLELDSGSSRHWWRQGERERCRRCRGSGSVEVVDERRTDASLRRAAAAEQARAGAIVSADWLDSALERRRAQWARGSYAELELALRRLAARAPRLHAALMRHVVYEPGEYVVSEALRARLERAVACIAAELPHPIRVPQEVKTAAARKHVLWRHRSQGALAQRRRRDSQIAASVLEQGRAPEQVALAHALTVKRVRQIVASAAAQVADDPAAVATFAL